MEGNRQTRHSWTAESSSKSEEGQSPHLSHEDFGVSPVEIIIFQATKFSSKTEERRTRRHLCFVT